MQHQHSNSNSVIWQTILATERLNHYGRTLHMVSWKADLCPTKCFAVKQFPCVVIFATINIITTTTKIIIIKIIIIIRHFAVICFFKNKICHKHAYNHHHHHHHHHKQMSQTKSTKWTTCLLLQNIKHNITNMFLSTSDIARHYTF